MSSLTAEETKIARELRWDIATHQVLYGLAREIYVQSMAIGMNIERGVGVYPSQVAEVSFKAAQLFLDYQQKKEKESADEFAANNQSNTG